MPTLDQWRSTWIGLGVSAPEGVFERLLACYGETHRKYHTLRHLDECFARFTEVRGEAVNPEEIELAIWFHDAIYDPKRSDNEAQSARWARSVVIDAGLGEVAAERVRSLIMATRHNETPTDEDARLLVDVDLSILGATPDRFAEYEQQVREEYAWVPGPLFRRERKKILESFLKRDAVFNTGHFRKTYEHQARENLRRSLERLNGSKVRFLERHENTVLLLLVAVLGIVSGILGIPLWAFLVVTAALSIAYWIVVAPRIHRAAAPIPRAGSTPVESKYAVVCTDEGIAVAFEGKQRESCRWDEILTVGIRIDDSFLPQPWWIVGGSDGGCMYPSDAKGWETAMHELSQRLPGFDLQAVIEAAGMMSGGVVVWEKRSEPR
jgi:predicted metal-dependent HD superfamily phosphohydrolase